MLIQNFRRLSTYSMQEEELGQCAIFEFTATTLYKKVILEPNCDRVPVMDNHVEEVVQS